MLTSRQETILKIIVDDYVKTATAVSSDAVAREHGLGVSSATVRNEVAFLEEEGYISRPHASAGSVPSDKAYRLYVESLIESRGSSISIPPRVRAAVRRQLSEIEREIDEWASVAAGVLSRLVGNLAITTFPKARESRVMHLELVPIQDVLAMLIIVLEQARLRRQLIRLDEPIDISDLEHSANRVKSEVVGLTRRQIEAKEMELTPLEVALVDTAVLMLREEDKAIYRDHYVDGLRNLLAQPEFANNDRVRALVEGIESGSLIQAVLEETPQGSIVRVVIGQENRGDMLWPMSVVICQYGIPGAAVGAVGAVGPTRMEYSKTIAGVRFMSSVMSDMVEAVRGG
ncbi:MAG: heat-inducible transcriptional repressor HrcA [Chloroflexi bacterium]|nr:heat-inducible transcriptional repressor HrcA [Chloroflexota bacterium]